MSRNYDKHRCAVTYRTAKMAAKDLLRLRSCGWQAWDGSASLQHDDRALFVLTYKPTTMFGEHGVTHERGTYRGDDLHKHGIVSWELACGCPYSSLSDDSSARGTLVRLQPTGADGRAFFPAAEYIIERVSWPCLERDNRASVAVRVPGEDSWRGRSIMVDVDALEMAIREKARA